MSKRPKRPSRRQAQQPQPRPPRKQQLQPPVRPRPLRSHLTRRRRLNSRLNPLAESICTYEEIHLSSRWTGIAAGLRTKRDDRDESAGREKGKQYDGGESVSSNFEQNGDEHDDQYRIYAQQRDEDGVDDNDDVFAESLSFPGASFSKVFSRNSFRGGRNS